MVRGSRVQRDIVMMRCVALLAIASFGEAVPRQLQTGTPDKCTSDASFQGWTAVSSGAPYGLFLHRSTQSG